MTADLRLLEHVENERGADRRSPLPVMPKRDQAVFDLFDGFGGQSDRDLDALSIALFGGHHSVITVSLHRNHIVSYIFIVSESTIEGGLAKKGGGPEGPPV